MDRDDVRLRLFCLAVGRRALDADVFDVIPGRQTPARTARQDQVAILPGVHLRNGGACGQQADAGKESASFHRYALK